MMLRTMELHAVIHHEDDSYWATVVELPGCFASGATREELMEALEEAIGLYLEDADAEPVEIQSVRRRGEPVPA
jgi:predicted RNase H-like HicB family nuclease